MNPSVYESRANPVKEKLAYSRKDMNDWARIREIQFNWPDIFPINSVKAMRGSFFALEKCVLPEYAEIIFSSYWSEGLDISSNKALVNISEKLGWDSKEFLAYIEESGIKEMLKQNTNELMERGGVGSLTIFLNDSDMYFGNDRLHLLEFVISSKN
jgi:2-hydroxychromene-2-carboxylate isomerase